MVDLDRLTPADIRARLDRQRETTYDVPPELIADPLREAAVLVPFVRVDAAWHLLFIRRTQFEGDRHSGQVAFAGGKRDAGDESLRATALREAGEEIGLAAADVELLGHINHHHTISRFQVRPYVATIPWPYPLRLDRTEVARAFTIPLAWLARPENYRTERRRPPRAERDWPVVYYRHYDGELLWGATARMTLSLIDLLSRED